jgi:hypothetical protein
MRRFFQRLIRTGFFSAFATAIYFTSTTARAQVVTTTPVVPAASQVAFSPWFMGGGGSYGGGTADGNFMFGMSQVIRAEGDYNLQTAQGMINYEEARSKYIENVNKWTQAYFQMREANQAYQIERAQRNRHSPETMALVAASDRPRRLDSDELDPVTGRISWPEGLMGERFAELRADIEHNFELRAWTSRSPGTAAKIHDDARLMTDLLREEIENMPAREFIEARKFIDALDYAVMPQRRAAAVPAPAPAEPPKAQ